MYDTVAVLETTKRRVQFYSKPETVEDEINAIKREYNEVFEFMYPEFYVNGQVEIEKARNGQHTLRVMVTAKKTFELSNG